MAVASKVSHSPLDPVPVGPGVPRITHGPIEAASQSYNAGQLVTISGVSVTTTTAGQVVVASGCCGDEIDREITI